MESETGLIHLPGVAEQQKARVMSTVTAEQLEELIGPWLPRIQLFTSNSTPAKTRCIEAGHWGLPLTPTNIIDLGENVDVILAAVRDKALVTMGDKFEVSTDKNSDKFKRIREMALSTDNQDGAMFGPEYLTWLGQLQLFGTVFLGTISARREAYAFMQALDKPAVLGSVLVGPNPRKRWEVQRVTVGETFPFALPTETVTQRAWAKFTAPDAGDQEEAAATTSRER